MTGIIEALLSKEERATQSAHPRDSVVAAWWGSGASTAAGVSVTPDKALTSGAVWAAVRLLAETVAMLPLFVYKRLPKDGREADRDHPLWRVLSDRPNRWQTPFEFREMMMGHVLLRGNAYAEILATGGNPIEEVMPLHPDRVVPFWAPDGRRAYRYQPREGGQRILLQDEVFHIHGLTSDGLKGLGPIQLHRETVGEDLAAQEYGARFLANDATPRGILEWGGSFGEGDAGDEAARAFKKSWQEEQTGVNRHKTAVLEEGMKYHEIGMSNEDAQFIETRGFTALQIARIFRVPPHMIGILDRATFSNIESQGRDFVNYSLGPWLARWKQAIRRDLMTAASRRTHFADFVLQALLQGDTQTRSKFYAAGRQWGWFSANDVRRLENLNPIDDGGDVYLSPVNMTPAELLAQQLEEAMDGSGD